MRRQRGERGGPVRLSGSRADPRAWGLGNSGRSVPQLQPLLVPPKGDGAGGAVPTAAQRGLLRAQSEVVLPPGKAGLGRHGQAAAALAGIAGVGPVDKRIADDLRKSSFAVELQGQQARDGLRMQQPAPELRKSRIVEDLRGPPHKEANPPAVDFDLPGSAPVDIVPASGSIEFAPSSVNTSGTSSLDRVFASVCSDIMNFNFKPYVRHTHWPIQRSSMAASSVGAPYTPAVAAGAPARALRRGPKK